VVPMVVLARWITVSIPITLLRRFRELPPYTISMLTWCGVRGGISIALALSLPSSPYRDGILLATYTVVAFTILVQGLSVGRFAAWVAART